MKKIYCASVLALTFGLCAQSASAVQAYPSASGSSAMSSGMPMQGGMPASARQQMDQMPHIQPGSYAQPAVSDMPYAERALRPSVLDAPPAWAQGSLPQQAFLTLAPFGSNLFNGHFAGTYSDGMNSDYVIMPGDRVAIRIWGAKVYEDVLAVDQHGNLFLPEVGPVKVAGLKQSALQSAVSRKMASVFTNNVNIYATLMSSQPVAVYVTGFVNQPGRYAGAPVDSVMSYLDRAGGITPASGSFRDIQVKRGGKTVASFDLYDFALNGNIKEFRLKDGDVILVGERGASVAAFGLLRQEARYEFSDTASGEQLIKFARPLPSVTHVSFSGVREGYPFHRYLALAEFAQETLADGDSIEFVTDARGRTIMTAVSGAIHGESRFPVKNSTSLRDLLAYVKVDPAIADTSSIYVRRQSVAQQQKTILEDSLRRLEQSTLTATSATAEEAEIRVREAELVQNFVQRASMLTPDGVVVVSRQGKISDFLLEDGDEVIIPQKSSVVQISGEVAMPKAVTFEPDMALKDYLKSAGGLTERGDSGNILVARMNGEVGPVSELGIRPGDRLLVMPRVDSKNLELAKGIMQILYQLAVSTKVVVDL